MSKLGVNMSASFPPIHAMPNVQYRQVPEITSTQSSVVKVYDDKVVTTTSEYTSYDKNGNVKTIVNTSQQIDILI